MVLLNKMPQALGAFTLTDCIETQLCRNILNGLRLRKVPEQLLIAVLKVGRRCKGYKLRDLATEVMHRQGCE